jgi:hypothetical protein
MEKNHKNAERRYTAGTRNRFTHRHWQVVREKDSAIDANTATTNIDIEFAGSGGSFGPMGSVPSAKQ